MTAVELTADSASPFGRERPVDARPGTLSSSRPQRATSSRLNQALEPAATGATRSWKLGIGAARRPGYSPFSVSSSNACAYRRNRAIASGGIELMRCAKHLDTRLWTSPSTIDWRFADHGWEARIVKTPHGKTQGDAAAMNLSSDGQLG